MQVETLERNCEEFGVPVYSLGSDRQGIVHVIGPELGVTQPGMTIVCGDCHTATHGAFGALAFGIGTSEVEHVLATQTLVAEQAEVDADPLRRASSASASPRRTSSSRTIGQMGVDGAVGHVVEFAGPAIEALSMEGRMTVCNMTIEGGGRAGMIAPDETTFAWLRRARRRDPRRSGATLRTDDGATFDREIVVDASALSPQVTWGTTPDMVVGVTDAVPEPHDRGRRARAGVHGAASPARRSPTSAGPRLHRLVHEQPHRRPARRRRGRRGPQGRLDGERDGRARARRRSRRRPRPRASTRSSAPPASTGAARAARCAWA